MASARRPKVAVTECGTTVTSEPMTFVPASAQVVPVQVVTAAGLAVNSVKTGANLYADTRRYGLRHDGGRRDRKRGDERYGKGQRTTDRCFHLAYPGCFSSLAGIVQGTA